MRLSPSPGLTSGPEECHGQEGYQVPLIVGSGQQIRVMDPFENQFLACR